MHPFTKKSIEIANSPEYLDKLSAVYNMGNNQTREIQENLWQEIIKSFESIDKNNLVSSVLKAKKAPVGDPFLQFLRLKPDSVSENPKTVKRITDKLMSVYLSYFKHSFEVPIENSRQFGATFTSWMKMKKTFDSSNNFQELFDYKGKKTLFLTGSDEHRTKFAKEKLGFESHSSKIKGLDLVVKKNQKYFLGEVKLITNKGGSQDNQFGIIQELLKIKSDKFETIGVLDGTPWLENSGFFKKIKNFEDNQIVISVLLLEDFLKTI
jgi:hypothetical protein